ncbi:hypothetical protein AAG906_029053 [Vitis piasezkii]
MSGQRRRGVTCPIEGCLGKSRQSATCPSRGSPYNKTWAKTIFQILSTTAQHVAPGKGIYEGTSFLKLLPGDVNLGFRTMTLSLVSVGQEMTLLVFAEKGSIESIGCLTSLCVLEGCSKFNSPAAQYARKRIASSSAIGQGGKGGRTVMSSGRPNSGKPTELLNEREFGDLTSTEKAAHNAIFFSKEQFNAGLRFPLLFLFKQFLHYTQIPPAYIHPNIVRVLMGCNILNMLFHLDLSLLEVLFVYTIKKGKKDIFSRHQGSSGANPGTCHSEPELEPIALRVINKSEADGDMSTDLRVGFKERHHKRLHEAIDMVPPPTKKACSEKAQKKLGREVLPMPVPHGPSNTLVAKKELVAGIRNMEHQCALLFERLEVAEAMRAFISHRMEGIEALKLVEGERKAIRAEAERLKKEGGVVEAKIKGVEQENSQLKKEMEELRAGFAAGFVTQKKGVGGWVRHSEEGAGGGVPKASGRNVLFRLPLLHEEERHYA